LNHNPSNSDKRILIADYEVCGDGGASTAAYGLFRKMLAGGLDVHLLNIIDQEDYDYFKFIYGDRMGNPNRLDNVHNCVLQQAEFFADPFQTALPGTILDISPDIAIGMDCIPTLLLKKSVPEVPVIFLACGSEQARLHTRSRRTKDVISLMESLESADYPPANFFAREVESVSSCDLIVANSDLTRDLYHYFYPGMAGKIGSRIGWFSEWICEDAAQFSDLARPFSKREFDVLFIANSWSRRVKNYPMAEQIISDCRDLKICVMGRFERRSKHAIHTGFIDSRRDLFAIMGNARSVVSTSVLDTAPGILFEAAVMGCNVVASRNCGNWRLCHPDLLVEPYSREAFSDSIRLAAEQPYKSNLDYFQESNSYQDLLDTVAVL